MTKQTEALKLALEALEQWETGCGTTEYLAKVEKATPLIREALAEQPAQQEFVCDDDFCVDCGMEYCECGEKDD